ncbi:MAG TPA: dTMP kinase [Solirubrobacteraceae bacterium]|nr:dTMP kinase [Solirubrobacteraceae bacterium]
MLRGRLITVEGVDGAGKSTLVQGLERSLQARGLAVRALREPGGVPAAERIRAIVTDPQATIGARAEALLYAAARAQLVEEALEPLLAAGTLVLLDRFVDSSLAYQGAGRGLGIDAVREINEFATGGLRPDRTLLLALDPTAARARSAGRAEPSDRMELAGAGFLERIADAYARLAAADPGRFRRIDASLEPHAVLDRALAEIEDLL